MSEERRTHAYRTLRDILSQDDTRPVKLLIALQLIGYGTWLILGQGGLVSGQPSWVWGTGMNVVGWALLVGLLGNHRRLRRWSCFAAWLVLLFFTILIGTISNWRVPGLAFFGLAALSAAWCYWRAQIGRAT